MPTSHVIAGPNCVGKATLADRYLPDEAKHVEFVNVDLLARGLSPYDPDGIAMEAGRVALGRIRRTIADEVGFTCETTMSGWSAAGWLRAAKAAGFTLKCYFLWVRQPEIVLTRVRQRVVEGVHNIREEVSRRRFFKTIANFFGIYRPLFDAWKFNENDLAEPRLLAVEKQGRFVARDRKRHTDILNEANVKL